MIHPLVAETGLTITNPLVLYRALVATKKIDADPAQHRLALHLQKLYHRLKDYEPEIEYREQLEAATRALGRPSAVVSRSPEPAEQPHGERIGTRQRLAGIWDGVRGRRVDAESLALTRRLTSHEAALHMDSPQGLLLYGEVGTGKSMLIDLLADSLPNRKKRRFHFNAFMLETFAQIEQQRILRTNINSGGSHQHEHTLIALARDLISTSPILFLDEFQLPDRASSKILSNLFTSFFQLGGVLVATSNRMPEELARASGAEFEELSSPTSRLGFAGLRNFFGAPQDNLRKGITSRQNDFTQFVDVLKARCETWNMESKVDFRRRESRSRRPRSTTHVSTEAATGAPSGSQQEMQQGGDAVHDGSSDSLPAYYFQSTPDLLSPDSLGEESLWQASILRAVDGGQLSVSDLPWQPEVLTVYGRKVAVPKACNGISLWTFDELCGAYLGPADYITLASTFHTLILTDVPVLTSVQKNEARRFITLLDALYESRCRLLIRAETGPDELFFPDQRLKHGKFTTDGSRPEQEGDSVYSETLSEIYQDATNPFRPNVSTYGIGGSHEAWSANAHGNTRSILADEDADFGPVYGAGRSAGASTNPTYIGSAGTGNTSGSHMGPNFQKTQNFTGQDERFAYKRAESRLWELCSQGWWDRAEWKPLSQGTRAWETSHLPSAVAEFDSAGTVHPDNRSTPNGFTDEDSRDSLFRHGASPFRVVDEAPPKLSWTHMWGMMPWGKKAGTWGKGTEGIEERLQAKQRGRHMLNQIETKPRQQKR